ncbi:hypothetical protein CYMTET_33906, partial [Cymbomonas tetramitiformis]
MQLLTFRQLVIYWPIKGRRTDARSQLRGAKLGVSCICLGAWHGQPLLYESAQCGAGTDVEAACNPSIIATCNATIDRGDVHPAPLCEQRCSEFRGQHRFSYHQEVEK